MYTYNYTYMYTQTTQMHIQKMYMEIHVHLHTSLRKTRKERKATQTNSTHSHKHTCTLYMYTSNKYCKRHKIYMYTIRAYEPVAVNVGDFGLELRACVADSECEERGEGTGTPLFAITPPPPRNTTCTEQYMQLRNYTARLARTRTCIC